MEMGMYLVFIGGVILGYCLGTFATYLWVRRVTVTFPLNNP